MLAEFLLTPDALSDNDDRNGTDVVRELTECFFPSRATPLALVCKLGEEWEQAASKKIARISNSNHRQGAMSLFQKLLREICIVRPAVQRTSDNESDWVIAGTTSANHVPLSKIVVSNQITPPATLGVSIKEFVSHEFWEQFPNPRLVGRETAMQEPVLRAICTHSDWIILRLPQIHGGSDDEIVTVKQIVRLATKLPHGYTKSDIELQIPLDSRPNAADLLQAVKNVLQTLVSPGVNLKVIVVPQGAFVNREMLAGDYAKDSSGHKKRRARWWVTMNHVAVGTRRDAGRDDANSWCLYSRRDADTRLAEIHAVTSLECATL